jgi:uncharacterized protein YuzE
MRMTYDHKADAAYIYVTENRTGGVTSSSLIDRHMDSAAVNCDFNDANQLVGVEVLGASRALPPDALAAAERIGD